MPKTSKPIKTAKSRLSELTYSIEFAHIYTDEVVNGNHFESVEVLKDILYSISFSTSKVVLIDDYNADAKGFNLRHYLNSLEDKGGKPDYYAFESELVPLANIFLDAIDKPKIRRMHLSYIERKGKYACSLLTATWYLVRLGHIEGGHIFHPVGRVDRQTPANADRLINILPSSFKDVEKEAHRLISHSEFKKDRFKIQPILFHEKYPIRGGFVPELVNAVKSVS